MSMVYTSIRNSKQNNKASTAPLFYSLVACEISIFTDLLFRLGLWEILHRIY